MNVPLVSVIMPCYRCADTVEAAVAGVRAQTMGDWELIAVDDGSDDNTPAVLQALARQEARMRVLRRENGGVSSARNAGMDVAKGRWLSFLDADDRLPPRALETLLAHAKGADVVCGACEIERDGRREILRCTGGGRLPMMESLLRGDSALNSMCGRIYRTDYVRRNGLHVREGIKIGEDVLFNLDALSVSEAWRVTEEVVYLYLERAGSAMAHARHDVYKSSLPMLRAMDTFLAENGLQTSLFRAHIDAYLRTLRADRGCLRAAAAMCGEPAHAVTLGVRPGELPAKQKLYWLMLRFMPILSFFMP